MKDWRLLVRLLRLRMRKLSEPGFMGLVGLVGLIKKEPPQLILVRTGNISTQALLKLFKTEHK